MSIRYPPEVERAAARGRPEWWRRAATSIRLLATVAVAVVLASFMASWLWHDWTVFERSGSITSLCGTLLMVRRLVRVGRQEMASAELGFDAGRVVDDPDGSKAKAVQRYIQDRADDHRATGIGLALALVGTLVWGYGSLLGK